MRGIVFTEYMEFLESNFGYEIVDKILLEADLPSGGTYTAVGSYDHSELVEIVMHSSRLSGKAAPELLKGFGKFLFQVFKKGYPVFFEGKISSFDFLSTIEDKIHPQVLKLYPDAELPRFDVSVSGNKMEMIYSSSRSMADFAEGLIEGCFEDFNEQAEILKENLQEDGTKVRFTITKTA
ncbi:MAG: heme NO-binding domain-containing protein [Cyclobacteriaceae bacterium]